jgi:hypothetical protein
VAYEASRGGRQGAAGRVAPPLLLLRRRAVGTRGPSTFNVKSEEREEEAVARR